jgi:hypothetical protein
MRIYKITRLHTHSDHIYVYANTGQEGVDYVFKNPNVKWRPNNDEETSIIQKMEVHDAQKQLRKHPDINIEYLDGSNVKLEDFDDKITPAS